MQTKQEWLKQLNSIHKYSDEETLVLKKAYIVKQDPRFYGTWEQAVSIAYDLHFDVIEVDPNAMRVRQ